MFLPASKNRHLVPDQPLDIGYKCSWFAIKDTNIQELASLFGLSQVQDCNWEYGLTAARANTKDIRIFISPPLRGWRLVLGHRLPFGDSALTYEAINALLVRASQLAGEAQFFATHRVVEFHCWMKAQAGVLVRAYTYLGDRLEVEQDVGIRTLGEPIDLLTAADVAAMEEDEERELSFPDEDLVMTIAAAWSVDPNAIANRDEVPSLGIVGTSSVFNQLNKVVFKK